MVGRRVSAHDDALAGVTAFGFFCREFYVKITVIHYPDVGRCEVESAIAGHIVRHPEQHGRRGVDDEKVDENLSLIAAVVGGFPAAYHVRDVAVFGAIRVFAEHFHELHGHVVVAIIDRRRAVFVHHHHRVAFEENRIAVFQALQHGF